MKLTIKQARENLPEPVATKVIEMAKERRIRQIGIRPCQTLYFAEDAKYYSYRPDGTWASIQVGGEWSGYHKNDPINQTVEMPIGAIVVETQIFLGKHFVTILHNNGVKELQG